LVLEWDDERRWKSWKSVEKLMYKFLFVHVNKLIRHVQDFYVVVLKWNNSNLKCIELLFRQSTAWKMLIQLLCCSFFTQYWICFSISLAMVEKHSRLTSLSFPIVVHGFFFLLSATLSTISAYSSLLIFDLDLLFAFS